MVESPPDIEALSLDDVKRLVDQLLEEVGQFNVGHHALCWVHAKRLIHKLVGFNDHQRRAVARIRARGFYADLRAYCRDSTPRRKLRAVRSPGSQTENSQ